MEQLKSVGQVRSYKLPVDFWVALWQVRDYWILEGKFGDHIYHPDHRDSALRHAFDLVDDNLMMVLMDEDYQY